MNEGERVVRRTSQATLHALCATRSPSFTLLSSANAPRWTQQMFPDDHVPNEHEAGAGDIRMAHNLR